MLSAIFITITILSLSLFYIGTGRNNRILWISVLWLLIIGITACNGAFQNLTARPPRFLFIPLFAIPLCIYFYKITIKKTIDTKYLLFIHTLRLPVELVLFELFLQKKIPILMTFQGWNFDILTGISAILILGYIFITKKSPGRRFLLAWNILGLVLLTIIVAIAILSSPLPFQQFAFDQPNIALVEFPFVYLPAYVVPVVLLSHLISIKQLTRLKA